MLDTHLAELYGVSTKALNQAVKRNPGRFPADFMFQFTSSEVRALSRSQFVTGSQRHRDPRALPYAFTEQGVAMLSSVLRSKCAVEVNILIMRVFVKLREMMALHQELAQKVEDLERKYNKHDDNIQSIFTAIKELLASPEGPQEKEKELGFRPSSK